MAKIPPVPADTRRRDTYGGREGAANGKQHCPGHRNVSASQHSAHGHADRPRAPRQACPTGERREGTLLAHANLCTPATANLASEDMRHVFQNECPSYLCSYASALMQSDRRGKRVQHHPTGTVWPQRRRPRRACRPKAATGLYNEGALLASKNKMQVLDEEGTFPVSSLNVSALPSMTSV